MNEIRDVFRDYSLAASRPARDQVMQRTILCMILAGVEGLLAASLVFATALGYHLVVLAMPPEQFLLSFYLAFATITGLIYGTSSAVWCGKFLDGGEGFKTALPSSFFGWTAAVALTLLTAFLIGKIGDLSRVSFTSAYLIGIPAVIGARRAARTFLSERIQSGLLHFEKVSVVGKRIDVVNFLLHGDLWRRGHKLTSALYLEDATDEDGQIGEEALESFARDSVRHGADYIVLVGDLSDMDAIGRMLMRMKRFALHVVYAPASTNAVLKFLDVVPIGPNNALRFVRKPLSDVDVFAKRTLDIVLSLVGLLLLSPLFLLVAAAIVIDSPGPVIFRQARRGFNGEPFMIWKFRSMSVTESGFAMVQAQAGDARITRVGRILRQTSIDELPQLVNVLLGQMSIVGPRPHAISHDAELAKQMANYAHRQRIKPGITGWAQVNGFRGETSSYQAIEGRILHDIYYIDNWSILLDLWTIVLTVVSPAARRNAR